MRSKFLWAFFLLLLSASCATGGRQNQAATSYLVFGDKLQSAVTTYRALEPKLTADQKMEFEEAYNRVCRAYQTAGTLLGAILRAGDEESANTAVLSYKRLMSELPALVDKVVWLVNDFKRGK